MAKSTKKGNRPSYDMKMKSIGKEMMRRKLNKALPKGPGFNAHARKRTTA